MLSQGPCKSEIGGSEQAWTEGNMTTETEVRERARVEDATLLSLKMEEGTMSQGMHSF